VDFIGRSKEAVILEKNYNLSESRLVVIYGRRRIGKSTLIKNFGEKKSDFYSFEAVEKLDTQSQIIHFQEQLAKQFSDSFLPQIVFTDWTQVFSYLTEKIVVRRSKKKVIFFFDELQWMAAGQEKLVSLIKFFWDNHWKNRNIMLILCGSVASFMVKKVLASNALYGRVNEEILLKGLTPPEAFLMFKNKRSFEEVLKYIMIFGTVPKYLEEIDLSKSFSQNIEKLCFSKNGLMLNEPERIFYSQFKEARTYQQIATLLKDGIFSMAEISEKLKIASGGGLKLYLDNLEHAEIIRSFIPFDKESGTKLKKFTLADEFLSFYFKYMAPNLAAIRESGSSKLFETITRDSFDIWLGFAFERFCVKNAQLFGELMGFNDEVLRAAPYFEKGNSAFQIDLLYKRADKVITLCEIKHYNAEITTKIIPEVERKCALLKIPKGYTLEKALISLYGEDEPLKNTGYFHHSITMKDIFKEKSNV